MAYDNLFYEKAENEIKRRKLSAESELTARIQSVQKEIPEIAEINAQLARTSIELSKLILRKDNNFKENLEKIKERNLQGQKMIRDRSAPLWRLPALKCPFHAMMKVSCPCS